MSVTTPTAEDASGMPPVLADPIGVTVALVAAIELGLTPAMIADIVAGVAGGRVKQRRLAQALADRPDMLRNGRSPAPRVVADLLIALRRAGAAAISAPACAGCDKPLRSLQRRGQDWYCAPCDRRPEPCCVCGQSRPVAFRDRQGRPQCVQCPVDERDPVDTVTAIVTGIEPGLTAESVAGVVHAAATRRGQRHQLAWELQDRPGRPISAMQLTKRLRDLGLNPAQSRSTALFELATELPAAILARMLGIHISVAAAWQRASAGDWTSYAADISRRNNTIGKIPKET